MSKRNKNTIEMTGLCPRLQYCVDAGCRLRHSVKETAKLVEKCDRGAYCTNGACTLRH